MTITKTIFSIKSNQDNPTFRYKTYISCFTTVALDPYFLLLSTHKPPIQASFFEHGKGPEGPMYHFHYSEHVAGTNCRKPLT
jgi:hypothetical protein